MNISRRRLMISSLLGGITIPFSNLIYGAQNQSKDYDYIIVGAGSAGCILAARLADRFPDASVLLIEAGGMVSKTEKVVWDPTLWILVSDRPHLEWGYQSVAQKNMSNRVISLKRAKGLGGCSLHNAMVYVRGGEAGFNRWEREESCAGWNFRNLKPHFEAVEKQMGISFGSSNDFLQDLGEACKAFQIPAVQDYNAQPNPYGFAPFQFAIRNGQRETSYTGFLENKDRKNLYVMTGQLASKVTFAGRKARSVELLNLSERSISKYNCRNEIILSAGAIGSPQILMLSGIGPASHLKSNGINSIQHSPGVGENFQDDLYVLADFITKKAFPKHSYPLVPSVIFGDGPQDPQQETLLETSMLTGNQPGLGLPPESQNIFAFYPNLLLLDSRGTVRLNTANPNDHPKIDPNYFSTQRDRQRAIEAVEFALDLGSSLKLKHWIQSPLRSLKSAAEIWSHIQTTSDTCFHYSGTCKMGIDDLSVVDPNLKVYGVEGLRIVDASIIPRTVSGNTAGATMAIAHRAADLIEEYV